MGNKHFGEGRLVMEHADEGFLFNPHDLAFADGCCRCDAPRLSGQTCLADEFVFSKNCDDGFLALLGDDRDLDLASLDVKNRIGGIALAEERFALAISRGGSSTADLG